MRCAALLCAGFVCVGGLWVGAPAPSVCLQHMFGLSGVTVGRPDSVYCMLCKGHGEQPRPSFEVLACVCNKRVVPGVYQGFICVQWGCVDCPASLFLSL